MTLTYPLSGADFFERFSLQSATLRLQFAQEMSKAGGSPLFADLAPAQWVAECETIPIPNIDVRKHMSRMYSLQGGIQSFFLHDVTAEYPQADTDGSILGASTVTVDTVHSASSVTLAGLPVGYVLTEGDFFQVTYGTPARTYLGQIVETVTANGSGNAGPFDIIPFFPAGVVATDSVNLIKPSVKCKIIPDTAYPGSITPTHKTMRFTAQQTHEAD